MALVESVVGLLEALDHTLVLFQRVYPAGLEARAKHGAVGRGAAGTAAIAEGNGGVLRPCPLSNKPASHLKALCMGQILGQRYAAQTW